MTRPPLIAIGRNQDDGKRVNWPPDPLAVRLPLVVNAEGAAALLAISERHFQRLDADGQCPMPLRLGSCKRWGVDELRAWVADGGPSRSAWKGKQ